MHHLHHLSSGVKFILSADRDIGSHSVTTQCTQRATIQDTWIKTPSVFIFSVLVGDQKTTPPAVSTVRALSEPPATLVSFITGSDGSGANCGVPPLQELGFLHLKVSDAAQRLPVLSLFCSSAGSCPVQTRETERNSFLSFFVSKMWRLWLAQELKATSTNTSRAVAAKPRQVLMLSLG